MEYLILLYLMWITKSYLLLEVANTASVSFEGESSWTETAAAKMDGWKWITGNRMETKAYDQAK